MHAMRMQTASTTSSERTAVLAASVVIDERRHNDGVGFGDAAPLVEVSTRRAFVRVGNFYVGDDSCDCTRR